MGNAIAENLREVEQRIADAADLGGRNASDVRLVVVTKTRSLDEIRAVLNCGDYALGENRVQEALAKIPEFPPRTLWHLIGHLQRNKAKQAVPNFAMIHSLDSRRLAAALQKAAENEERIVEALVEVNVSGEESKFGVAPGDVHALLEEIGRSFDRLRVRGLMTMAPFVDDPEEVRPVFRGLREMRDRLAGAGHELVHLSMGMTNDYEVAIEEGATLVRIGTAIFGPRDV